MNRRELAHVAVVLGGAIVARVLLFNQVGVWGDFGFWAYDARLILEGQTPFVDFLGRSPAYVYLLAGVRAAVGHPLVSLRATTIAMWLLASPLVYAFARRIHSHRAGVVALGAYLLTPFPLVYGMWVNSQGFAALLTMAALWAVSSRPRGHGYAIAGSLLAVAFLARRSAIVVVGAVVAWALYRAWQGDRATYRGLLPAGVAGSAFLLTLFVGYLAVMQSLGGAWALFETHFVNLLISTGRGGFPMVGVDVPPYQNQIDQGRVPILNDLCQLCGAWTARVGLKTVLLSTSVIGPLWLYGRDVTDRWMTTRDLQYMYGTLALLLVYAMYRAARAGYWLRIFGLLALVAFAVAAYESDAVERDILYQPAAQLLLLTMAFLAAGYLYRNRLLHTYYFMDFWPMLSVIAGVAAVLLWDDGRETVRALLVIGIVVGILTSGAAAYPLMDIAIEGNQAGWFTIGLMYEYQGDINERTEAGETIFTAHPNYVVGTHAELFHDRGRIYQIGLRYRDTSVGWRMYRHLRHGLRTGAIDYVILSGLTREIVSWDRPTAEAFRRHYCRRPARASLYETTNGAVYAYDPACPSGQRPPLITET